MKTFYSYRNSQTADISVTFLLCFHLQTVSSLVNYDYEVQRDQLYPLLANILDSYQMTKFLVTHKLCDTSLIECDL